VVPPIRAAIIGVRAYGIFGGRRRHGQVLSYFYFEGRPQVHEAANPRRDGADRGGMDKAAGLLTR
jgi:hypothetical protein